MYLASLACSAAGGVEFIVLDHLGRPLENAVVTVASDDRDETGQSTAVVEQRGQQFAPRVTVVKRGSTVRFPNRDDTQHHVYSFASVKSFEIELYGGDEPPAEEFPESGIVPIGCNIHDWMLGYIVVTDDSHYGVTDSEGVAAIDATINADVAITFWHPAQVDEEPAVIALDDLKRDSRNRWQVTIKVGENDPLKTQVDPLQSLFGASR